MASVRVFYLTDLHFKKTTVSRNTEISEAIIKVASTTEFDFIVLGGDLLNDHQKIDSHTLCQSVEMIQKLSLIKPVYLLIGNHECTNNTETEHEIHPFTALRYWEKVSVIDKPKIIHLKGFSFGFAPYYPPGTFKKMVLNDEMSQVQVIFCHQEFQSSSYNGISSVVGDSWDSTDPFVISGHIHLQQVSQSNIFYPGSSVQSDFGDLGDKTAFLLTFDSDGFTPTPLELEVEKFLLIYIKHEDLTQFIPPEKVKCKVIVECTPEMMYTLAESTVVKALRKKCKVDLKATLPPIIRERIEIKKINFLELLYRESSANPKEQEWFEKLFGKPTL
jgi:DNA repair exonuclease SbcCD nuclease subunit